MRSHVAYLALLAFVGCGPAPGPADPPDVAKEQPPTGKAYELRFDRPHVVGRKLRVSIAEERATEETRIIDGAPQHRESATSWSLLAVQTVKEVDERGRPLLLQYVVESLSVGEARGPRKLLGDGVVVNLRRAETEEQASLSAVGAPLDEEAKLVLSKMLDLTIADSDDDLVFGPKRPVRVGETWKLDPEEVRKGAGDDFADFAFERIDGEMSVASETRVGPHPCLEIEGVFRAELSRLPDLPPELRKQGGHLTARLWGMFPTDLELPELKNRVRLTVAFEASGLVEGKHVVVRLKLDQDRRQEVEIL
jgi:hypothetical protein